MSGNGAADGSVPGGENHGDDGESARERARKKARLDRIFRSMYPGQGALAAVDSVHATTTSNALLITVDEEGVLL